MNDKIDRTINYYEVKGNEILQLVNSRSDLTADELIYFGEEMAKIEFKLTALEVAKEN